jgi:hypothetical protein
MSFSTRLLGFVLAAAGATATACGALESTADVPPGDDGGADGDGGSDAGADTSFGPLDPGFMGTPPGVWQTSGGATIETWVPNGVDPGVARFDPAKIPGGVIAFVTQYFETPAYSLTQQYALETIGVGGGVEARVDNMTLGAIMLGSSPTKYRICLGERAFGHVIGLAFGATGSQGVIDLDHVSTPPAPECPPAGALFNGDFESSDGWTATAQSEIVATGGPSTGHAGHLAVNSDSETVLDHAPVSFPWKTMARPAMRIVAKGNGPAFELRAPHVFGRVNVTAAPATTLVCVPEWMKGLVLPFSVARRQGTTKAAVEYFVDDLAFVSEPSCPESSFVLGGGFEGPTAETYWAIDASQVYFNSPPPMLPPTAGIAFTGDAHGGASHVLFSLPESCERATATQTITVPPPEPGRGPALKLWYKTSGPGQATTTVSVNSTLQSANLPAAPSWTQHTLCLDPYGGSRPTDLFIVTQLLNTGAGCGAIPLETVAIDDVEVTTDPSCPSK